MRRLWTVLSVILMASSSFAQSGTVSRLDKLEVGVERAEAIRAIKRLQTAYHGYLDNGLWNDISDLLTANATADFAGTKVVGKAAIAQHLMQEAGRTEPGLAKDQLNTHLLMQPIINLGPDGKTAMGTWHELAMLGRNAGKLDATAFWVGGIYENTYAIEKGVWKIASIGFHEQYRGAYSEPGQKAPPKWDIPYHFEAAHAGLTIPPSALVATVSSNKNEAARLAQLTARVNRLEDETAVMNLQHMYGYYLDRKHFDDIADLFVKGGTWNGKTNVRETLESLYGAPQMRYGELFDHLMLGTVVTVAADGKTAMARSTELAQAGLINEYARWELGTYENKFVKENGVWKLQSVNYYKRLVSPYEQGWAKEGLTDFSFPAFHYLNPVTGKTPRYPAGVVQSATILAGITVQRVANSAAVDEASLRAAERSVARSIGVDAAENLNSAYGYYLDESAWDAVADMMSNRGVFDLSSVGIYIGRERARKALHLRYPNSGRGPTFFTIHQLVQPVTHISEDGRVAKSRFRLFQGGGSANGSSASWIGGTYENRAVFEDGEWKFYEKDLQHSFSATQKDGWAKIAARPARATNTKAPPPTNTTKAKQPTVAQQFPPDLPERTEQYGFPEVAEPSFHYVNPVSGRKPPVLLEAPPIP